MAFANFFEIGILITRQFCPWFKNLQCMPAWFIELYALKNSKNVML